MPPRFSLILTDLTSSVNAPLVLYVKRNLGYIDVSFAPYTIFQWYLQSNEILLNLGVKC